MSSTCKGDDNKLAAAELFVPLRAQLALAPRGVVNAHLLLAEALAQHLLQQRAALATAAGVDEHQDGALRRAADLLVRRHTLAVIYLRHGVLQVPHRDAARTVWAPSGTPRMVRLNMCRGGRSKREH